LGAAIIALTNEKTKARQASFVTVDAEEVGARVMGDDHSPHSADVG
jgi:hypothetical protein